MLESPRKPSKPWRVISADGVSADYRSQPKAHEAVRAITGDGGTAYVYQWLNGRWYRYEALAPNGEDVNTGWPDEAATGTGEGDS